VLIDARSLPAEAVLEADICIVGGGPAGLTLAHELDKTPFRVCLLESGGREADPQLEALSEGETVSEHYRNLAQMRTRQLGGTANQRNIELGEDLLGVRYVPLGEIDFEERDWVPYSGWPFPKGELEPFYRRAHEFCQAGAYGYEVETWEDEGVARLPFAGDAVATGVFRFGPRSVFTELAGRELERSDNVQAYLHATVVRVERHEPGGMTRRVRVACLDGKRFSVAARVVVLAAGAIENARLLLLSDDLRGVGLGNERGLVGRFFMDHPLLQGGFFTPSDRGLFARTGLYDVRSHDGVAVMGKLVLGDTVMREERLLNMNAILIPRERTYGSAAVRSLKALVRREPRSASGEGTLAHVANVVRGLDDIAAKAARTLLRADAPVTHLSRGGWSQSPRSTGRFAFFEVYHVPEQAPDPDNRITLGTERDPLGCRKVCVRWRLGEQDLKSIRRGHEIFADELARIGPGEVRRVGSRGEPQLVDMTHHHMGTTRMHADPARGVVDRNCRVHGTQGLFLAGGSVFPTGGYANPTLTIVALAMRLADHVKDVVASRTAAAG